MTDHNHLRNFGTGHFEEQFCEIILNLGFGSGDVVLRYFLNRALAVILFGGAEPLGQL